MAEPKWTPGPWRIGPEYLDDEGHREIAIQAPNGVGGECTPASVVLQFPQVDGMQDANAALIAAAPSMYTALFAAFNALRSYQYGNASPDLAEDTADAIAALLAKARGEP